MDVHIIFFIIIKFILSLFFFFPLSLPLQDLSGKDFTLLGFKAVRITIHSEFKPLFKTMSSGLWGMLNGRRKTPVLGLLFGCFVSGGLWNFCFCPTLTPRQISQKPLLQLGRFGRDFPLALAMVKHQGLPCVLKLVDYHRSFIYSFLRKRLEHGSAHSNPGPEWVWCLWKGMWGTPHSSGSWHCMCDFSDLYWCYKENSFCLYFLPSYPPL